METKIYVYVMRVGFVLGTLLLVLAPFVALNYVFEWVPEAANLSLWENIEYVAIFLISGMLFVVTSYYERCRCGDIKIFTLSNIDLRMPWLFNAFAAGYGVDKDEARNILGLHKVSGLKERKIFGLSKDAPVGIDFVTLFTFTNGGSLLGSTVTKNWYLKA